MSILGQAIGLNVILSQVVLPWLRNWVVKPSQKEVKTHLCHVNFKAIGVTSRCDLPLSICFTTQLANFIDSIDITLSYSSYIQCLITRFITKL